MVKLRLYVAGGAPNSVRAIANLAVRNKDDALKTILTQQGITFNVSQPASTAAPQAPEAKGGR